MTKARKPPPPVSAMDWEVDPRYIRVCHGYWPLPVAAMQQLGGAARLVARLYETCGRNGCFRSLRNMAAELRMPRATIAKMLAKCETAGWLVNTGRQKTRTGRLRRTVTWRLSKLAREQKMPFVPWPKWTDWYPMAWTTAEVFCYSVILNRYCTLWDANPDNQRVGADDALRQRDDYEGPADERYGISLAEFEQVTGLSRPSIVQGLKSLERTYGVIRCIRSKDRATGFHRNEYDLTLDRDGEPWKRIQDEWQLRAVHADDP
jgi:hypothetical protein